MRAPHCFPGIEGAQASPLATSDVLRSLCRPTRQQGLLTIELILLLPLILMFALVILQSVFLLHGWIVVNHAAQTAARSAMVIVPVPMKDKKTGAIEPANVIEREEGKSPKTERIRRAAAMNLITVSPSLTPEELLLTYLPDIKLPKAEALGEVLSGMDDLLLKQISVTLQLPGTASAVTQERLGILGRIIYAFGKHTRISVDVQRMPKQEGSLADPHVATVTLSYRYYLAIPFADRLFGIPYIGNSFFSIGPRYRELTAKYALPFDATRLYPAGDDRTPGVLIDDEIYE